MSEECVEAPLADVDSMLAGKVEALESTLGALCEIIQEVGRVGGNAKGLFEVVTYAQRQGLNVDRLSEEILTLLTVRLRLLSYLSPEARAEWEGTFALPEPSNAPIQLPMKHG